MVDGSWPAQGAGALASVYWMASPLPHSRMPRLHTHGLLLIACLALPQAARAQDVPFTVADVPWDAELLGNHRAVLRLTAEGRFASATLPWRRPDRNPNAKALIVTTNDGRTVTNVRRVDISQAAGTIDFEPIAGPGRYFVYYLPFKSGGRSNYPNVTYLPVENTADSSWLAALDVATTRPRAQVERFESVDSLNAFWPMLVIATDAERRRLEADAGDARMLVFPEDRLHPIVMRDQLPYRWARRGPGGSLADTAARGEFVAFQLGVVNRASASALENVRVRFGALTGAGGTIAASAFTSFNEGGIGWDGRPFTTRVHIPAARVQAMWCGVDIPASTAPGTYAGLVHIVADGEREVTIPVSLTVTAQVARAGGADEPWKLTRLTWLNSTIAQANTVIRPYTPITVRGNTLRLHGREVTLGSNGLPRSIATFFTPEMTGLQSTPVPVLRAPATLHVNDGGRAPKPGGVRFTRRDPGTVQWVSTTQATAWTLEVRGTLEFDGALTYETVLRATKPVDARDIALVIPSPTPRPPMRWDSASRARLAPRCSTGRGTWPPGTRTARGLAA
jgi:Family of unknown function (DUF6067)